MPRIYPWLKGLHVAAALIFVGGLIAETAFLAALRQTEGVTADSRRFVAAFRMWDRLLTTPALLIVWGLGLTLALCDGWFTAGWLQAKLLFVIALSALHGIQSGTLRRLSGAAGRPQAQTVPIIVILVSVVAIAILAVAKPF
jgi:uncharacterized membrane protein